jgi:hypothetical protein
MFSHGIEMELVFGHSLLSTVLILLPGLEEENKDSSGQEQCSQDPSSTVDQLTRGQVEFQAPPAGPENSLQHAGRS